MKRTYEATIERLEGDCIFLSEAVDVMIADRKYFEEQMNEWKKRYHAAKESQKAWAVRYLALRKKQNG